MTRILYVGGSARSGSTLLGEMLGSQPGAFNGGEISLFWRDLNRGGRCGCGMPIIECPAWSETIATVIETHGLTPGRRAQMADTRARLAPSNQVPRLARLAHIPDADWPQEIRDLVLVTGSLVTGLLERHNATTLVDTSKTLPSLLFMRLAFSDVHLALLHRDPRGVVASFGRSIANQRHNDQSLPPGARPAPAVARWSRSNLMLLAGARMAHSHSVLSYEELVAQPVETLGRVCSGASLRLDTATLSTDGFRPAEKALHAAVGNPGRGAGGFRPLTADERWRTQLSPSTATLVAGATWPLRLALRRSR